MSDDTRDSAAAVQRFAEAMKDKMQFSAVKGRRGWDNPKQYSTESLAAALVHHVTKGDPIDVACFCMMLWHRPDGIEALIKAAHPPMVLAQPALVDDVSSRSVDTLLMENRALRHLANNLRPGPISVALGGAEHEAPYRAQADRLRLHRLINDVWAQAGMTNDLDPKTIDDLIAQWRDEDHADAPKQQSLSNIGATFSRALVRSAQEATAAPGGSSVRISSPEQETEEAEARLTRFIEHCSARGLDFGNRETAQRFFNHPEVRKAAKTAAHQDEEFDPLACRRIIELMGLM